MNGVRFDLTMGELLVKDVYEEHLLIIVDRHTRAVNYKLDTLHKPVREKLTEIALGMLDKIDAFYQNSTESSGVCHWRLSTVLDCVLWHTDCGLDWQFSNPETPAENEMAYCPKCGKRLEEE